ncbi:hypothetical protein L9G16_24400 [Shewanella sp. A25]|nr:hypothetical protein [Shewanella shenzhenensis]
MYHLTAVIALSSLHADNLLAGDEFLANKVLLHEMSADMVFGWIVIAAVGVRRSCGR